jgi:hypothetical protein
MYAADTPTMTATSRRHAVLHPYPGDPGVGFVTSFQLYPTISTVVTLAMIGVIGGPG